MCTEYGPFKYTNFKKFSQFLFLPIPFFQKLFFNSPCLLTAEKKFYILRTDFKSRRSPVFNIKFFLITTFLVASSYPSLGNAMEGSFKENCLSKWEGYESQSLSLPRVTSLEEKELGEKEPSLDSINLIEKEIWWVLGNYYVIVRKDLTRAMPYLERAAQTGHDKACRIVGNFLMAPPRSNYKKAFYYFEKGAEKKGLECMSALAEIYFERGETEKDIRKALELYSEIFTKTIHLQNKPSLNNFILSYHLGNGVPQDAAKALQLARLILPEEEKKCFYES